MTQAAPSAHTQAEATPSSPSAHSRMTMPAKVRVNLKMLLSAPSGQMYLHQNILTKKLPRKSSATEMTVIQTVISPLKPVATA